jgi:hypothetical protein
LGRLYTTGFSNNNETLRQSPALKTLFTDISILKDLAGDRGQQEGGREGSYTRFELFFDVLGQSGWAVHKGVDMANITPRISISRSIRK